MPELADFAASGTQPEPVGGAHVHILMCTYNGARYLPDQLTSLEGQSHRNWSLWVSDDGSSDLTISVLKRYSEEHPNREVRLFHGPRDGSAANFLLLLGRKGPASGHVALSDQDDVWLPDRLERGLRRLSAGVQGSAIYGSATIVARDDLTPIRRSRRHALGPSFANSLVQNTLPGNTILLNPDAYEIARFAARSQPRVPYHDWWLYQLMAAVGARIEIDDRPTVLYRQHGRNLLGAHRGFSASMSRLAIIASSRYGGWLRANSQALAQCGLRLPRENARLLSDFRAALDVSAPRRTAILNRLGIRRQTGFGTFCVFAASALGRL